MDEVSEKDLLFAEADMFARFIEGKLSPELTREIEVFMETSPEARTMADFAYATLAEQNIATEIDWTGCLRTVTGRAYNYKAWLPSPLMDHLEDRRREAAADPDSRRNIVDQFELEQGQFSLFWQGEDLFVELITTEPQWWRTVAEAWLLTPRADDRSNPFVNAKALLELSSDGSGRYLCTVAIPISGELTEESRLYVSVPHSPPNLNEELLTASGKLRPGNVDVSDAILRQLRGTMAEASRNSMQSVSSGKPDGYRRIAVNTNGLACALFWDNVYRKMNLYAEITDPALVGKCFEFALIAGSEHSRMIGNTSHVFREVRVPIETTFELAEEFSRGGMNISLHVANVSA